MQLGTFGSILTFAIGWETRAADFYGEAARGGIAHGDASAALFAELGQRSRKRLRRLETARREGVAEMILESITGLDSASYPVEMDPATGKAALLAQARTMEETAAHFYEDAAAKVPIREVSRLLRSLAEESRQSRERLAAMEGNRFEIDGATHKEVHDASTV